ncbi:helix-turn-helix transcriptional regulator [Conexibacter woesei]|uniref:Transcriptional regulator, LuxR family n=1 Tax=Conexibacter woesei (strain DSM 14684 / CCUG 47730 / CIP 108061 / JCM 11494 / NBRC 100937 / ID131577) TaxID=469383 RepID=D3FF32_CONWI|nr:LuxR C-terminal-related transcriptional regulator [Conexibacter woesei]ADB51749.1 transcriptional regulator, LuxR family [Conexibacter woesei DSM 14684]
MAVLASSDATWALAASGRLIRSPRPETLRVLAELADEVLPAGPGRLVAMLTGDCSRAPLKLHGGDALPGPVTSAELGRLTSVVEVGTPWVDVARIGGAERSVLAVATGSATAAGSAGSLFAIELADPEPPPEAVRIVHGLCEIAAAAFAERATEPEPGQLVENLAAAQERARAIVELGEAHEAALTALLSALRARDLSDRAARAAATDLAVSALIELREAGDRDRALSEEPAAAAFDRLRQQLLPIGRYASAALELAGPDAGERVLPSELAHAARAISRGVALVLLDQDGVGRIRVSWRVTPAELLLSARDDGPGALTDAALAVHRTGERVAALGGSVSVDAVAGWGTTVTVALPLAPVESGPPNPLAVLNARELEVLAELARGGRNRQIAEALAITPHTVKFHVANILRKLGVSSRGEAAALAHRHAH